MNVIPTSLPEVLVIEPKVFADERGYFMETWSSARYHELGIPPFIQDNVSLSRRAVLRGLHYQEPFAQGKLVCVLQGNVFDVAVDVRSDSPTFAKWAGVILSGENKRQVYVPPGFAHGFCVISDVALLVYKCTERYAPEAEGSVLWNDPDIGIEWPVRQPILSEKDGAALRLRDIDRARLPSYRRKDKSTSVAPHADLVNLNGSKS